VPIEQGEGDSFVAAFALASDALSCALSLQLEFGGASWQFAVRMALHTGEAQTRDGARYEGTAIIRCARLRAIAHGGQTVVSQATHDLVLDQLPDAAWLEDMGVHRLEDLDRPERVHQLRHPRLTLNPMPLRSAAVRGNLPVQLTSFVGREREIGVVRSLLENNRIVSLLGVGGCGKTRVAVEVAERAMAQFPDGVWFVELAPIADSELIAHKLLATIGGPQQHARAPIETLRAALAGRTVLLVLDNCEHVVEAAAAVSADLLSTSPQLSILATSREQLGVTGEVTFTLPSLAIETDAVELFVDRAARARPGFVVTADNADAVSEICRRLDGIPLALELAAARLRSLSPEQVCDGLSDRFQFLSTGARTSAPRQQTLRGSVDWSFDLLSDRERATLRRASVFAGGFDLDAAGAVVGDDDDIVAGDVRDLVGSLVDKSLVLVDDRGREVRYRMLETIREYGAERLDAAGERAGVARRHRMYYRSFLRRAAAEEEGPDQVAWRTRVMNEMDNVRAALTSSLADDDGAALIELTC
ncbi:MAG TPA: NB-ARC domain-containing protein, partial [Ilumatobacteraceae bacterium]